MGTSYDEITDAMRTFIERQHLFFVATAPAEGGRVNLSPKGYDSFRVLGPSRVAYLDYTGSGAETIAHVRQNGRITFMFCAFEGKPNIVRLYGTADVILADDPRFATLRGHFPTEQTVRSVISVEVQSTSSSCGFSVPFMDYVGERNRLSEWTASRSDDELAAYWAAKNASSIDGIAALGSDGGTTSEPAVGT